MARKPLTAEEAVGKDTNSILQGFVDRSPWTFWDTINETAGALQASYNPFAVPIGGQDPVSGTQKTKLQTNMRKGNEFPAPQCLILFALGVYFSSSMSKSDIDFWVQNCYLEFKIDEKVFHEGLLWMFPAGGGLSGLSTNNAESCWTNGLPAPQYTRRYDTWSRYIAPNQAISMTLTFPGTPPTTTGTSQVIFTLEGITDRSVQ